ncbi:glycosyltransferase family 2 protein [Mucilaginibacter pedocola]|uniref:Glycosyltransferase 2-like domain-containing protein n=1 Tax=Mucilaginibacter pedocola TaxID=1792845 RepID=A0A1S9PET7_9SPHI|nr:glycosyltransferase family 2 protein [Mucilaginibacter pedocola]OOQ59466.1 hypothetical protein BC343_04600 [Mucilaginibacter pedocola]
MSQLGLVTVLFKADDVLEGFFESLSIQNFKDYHLYLVDNSPNEGTDKLIQTLSAKFGVTNYTHVKNAGNEGVARGNNIGIELSVKDGTTHTVLLNNDIEFSQPDLLSDMLRYAIEHNEPMIVPKIYFHDNRKVWMAGGEFLLYKGLTTHVGEGDNDGTKYSREAYFDYAPTCFMLIDNKVFEKAGLMDEKYFVYYDDTDFIFRTNKLGYKIKLLPNLHIYHKVSSITGGKTTLFSIYYGTRNRIYFIRKNLSGLQYFCSMGFTLFARLLRYLQFDKEQKAKLVTGLKDGFKLNPAGTSPLKP